MSVATVDRMSTSRLPLLVQTVERLADLGPAFAVAARKLPVLHGWLAEEHFPLAVFGRFKRGKSTQLNALLSKALLPISVAPLTAIPTFLFPGSIPRVTIVNEHERSPGTFMPRQPRELGASS